MKQTIAFNLRAITLLFASLLCMHACKKTDPGHHPGCPTPPACNEQQLLVTLEYDSLIPPHGKYPGPYKFYKTYRPDGRVSYIDAYTGLMWGYIHFKGDVQYAGNKVFMLDSTGQDTLMVARLNACGQPVSAYLYQNEYFNYRFTYQYDHKRRLSKVEWVYNDGSSPAYIDVYEYDKYDNVTRIYNQLDPTLYITYTYDYNRPAKGNYYEQGITHTTGTELLELLGLIDLQSHHVRLNITVTYDYPTGTWPYYDHVINANGYLESYKVNLYDNIYNAAKCENSWNCISNGGGNWH